MDIDSFPEINEQPKQTPTEASRGFLKALRNNLRRIVKDDIAVMSGSYFGIVASAMTAGVGMGIHSLLPIVLGTLGIGVSASFMLRKAESTINENKELRKQVSGLRSKQYSKN